MAIPAVGAPAPPHMPRTMQCCITLAALTALAGVGLLITAVTHYARRTGTESLLGNSRYSGLRAYLGNWPTSIRHAYILGGGLTLAIGALLGGPLLCLWRGAKSDATLRATLMEVETNISPCTSCTTYVLAALGTALLAVAAVSYARSHHPGAGARYLVWGSCFMMVPLAVGTTLAVPKIWRYLTG